MKLLSDRILGELIQRPRVTASGLHLPESAGVDFADGNFFRVLDVGPACKEVRKGDLVFFHSYHESGQALPDGKKIIREASVLLIIEP